jgi:hypothetical protein
VVETVIVKSTAVEPVPAKSSKSAAVKAAAPTPAIRPGMDEIWLDHRATAYERACDRQSFSYPGPDTMFA